MVVIYICFNKGFFNKEQGLHLLLDIRIDIYNIAKDYDGLVKQLCYGYVSFKIHNFTSSGLSPVFSNRHVFPLVHVLLNPISEQLAPAKVWMELLYPQGYCTMLVIYVVHRHHSLVEFCCLSPFEACMPHFDNIKVSPQGGGILGSSN